MIQEIITISHDLREHLRKSCFDAVRIGARLLVLHKLTGENETPGGFRAALDALEGEAIPRSTAYRWINAAAALLGKHFEADELAEIELPEPGSPAWIKLESSMEIACRGMSVRRLTIGSATNGDEARLDKLITSAEDGDSDAEAMLEKVASGELTLVQAIRANAGRKTTKGKNRKDPIYLDIDGRTGEPRGLFCKSLITLSNTFNRWDSIDEIAREKARSAWKSLVAQLPKDLR
ncbi:hypothetical protein [Luteolibacter pohnpeiensis]|uniref:hypothetical protein n=1 Tax=Luteolibacter pohnpeiensis TaxID=454153 RepID=UPI001904E83A|nr:hypothetical protein [Luteolibacter pohnpeiensis]